MRADTAAEGLTKTPPSVSKRAYPITVAMMLRISARWQQVTMKSWVRVGVHPFW